LYIIKKIREIFLRDNKFLRGSQCLIFRLVRSQTSLKSVQKFFFSVFFCTVETMPNNLFSEWNLEMSSFAHKTINLHRIMGENPSVFPNPNKKAITLQYGDPTIFGKPD
jgi:hypothetical protein